MNRAAGRFIACAALAAATCCAGNPGTVELRGRILTPEGKPIVGRRVIQVNLHSSDSPFVESKLTLAGNFKFKNVKPGPYTLTSMVRGVGEVRQSVDVAASLADEKGRLHVDVRLRHPNSRRGAGHTVSARVLSIPYSSWSLYQRAYQALGRHQVDDAISLLKKALEKTPQFTEALNLMGTIFYHRRELEQAREYFEQAFEIDPTVYEPIVNLGGTLFNLSRFHEALALNRTAVQMRPEDPLANTQLGVTYYALGDADSAIEHLTRAKTLDPAHFSHPQMTLAEIYLRRGENKAAVAELEEFTRLHPDHPNTPAIRKRLPGLRSGF